MQTLEVFICGSKSVPNGFQLCALLVDIHNPPDALQAYNVLVLFGSNLI